MLVILLLTLLYGILMRCVLRTSPRKYSQLSDEELKREETQLLSISKRVKSKQDHSLVARYLNDLREEIRKRNVKKQ